MKVFRLNEYDWYIGDDLESVKATYREDTGLDGEEAFDPDYLKELTEEDLKKYKFRDEDAEPGPDGKYPTRTFLEEFEMEIRKGGIFPRLFASTEY